jgi:hypothetical protein
LAEPSLSDTGDISGGTPIATELPEVPGAVDTAPSLIGAMFRQTTTPGSLFSSNSLDERLLPTDTTPMSTDQLIEAMDRDGMWTHEDHFLQVRTVGMYNAIRRDIEQETADREVIADAGMMNALGAGILVAPLDPLNWLPVGAAVNRIRTGSTILNTTLRTAGAAGISSALQEPLLQASQELRTQEEAAFDIGGSMLLGGILGGGAAVVASGATSASAQRAVQAARSWFTSTDWNERVLDNSIAAWNQINDAIRTNPQGRRTAGGGRAPSVRQLEQREEAFDALQAAAERIEAVNDLRMATSGPMEWARTAIPRLAGKVLGPSFLDPIDYVTKRTATLAGKEALEKLIELPVLLNKNLEGRPTAQAATTAMDQYIGHWAAFRDSLYGGSLTEAGKRTMGVGDSLYTAARRQGFTGGFEEFDRQIFRAVVNGHVDPGGNPAITQAAQRFRELTESHRELAARAGYQLPNTPRGALGYAPRHYIVPNVVGPDGRGTQFIADVRRGYRNELLTDALAALPPGQTLSPQARAGIDRRAARLARQAFARITKETNVDGGLRYADATAGSPLRERVIPLADSFLLERGYIDGRATDVINLHIRRTVPELLLGERFRTATDLPDPSLENSVIPAITREYEQLMANVTDATERAALQKERNNLHAVFRNLRDGILSGPTIGDSGVNFRPLENAVGLVKMYQATRLMGGLLIASIPDVANLQLRHGLGRTLTTFANDISRAERLGSAARLQGLKPEFVADEAKRWGASVEWATNSVMASHLDLLSPYQANTPFQRGLANLSKTFSVANFSIFWNDTMKTAAFRAGMDRVLTAAERGFANISEAEQRMLSSLGLGAREVNRIGAAWRSQNHALNDGFLRWGQMSEWADQDAARLLANALAKDNASTVIRPRLGDKATITTNPIVQLLIQFQNFTFSHALRTLTLAEQRVIAERGMGRDSLRVYGGLSTMVMLGMASHYLYALARDAVKGVNGEEMPTVEKLHRNPGQWISGGLERSSILGLYGYYNNYYERLGNVGITRALQTAAGDESLQVEHKGRWYDRDPAQVLLGPTASQTIDLFKLGNHFNRNVFDDKPLRKFDARTVREAFPFQNHIIMRHVFDEAQRWLGEDIMGIAYDN